MSGLFVSQPPFLFQVWPDLEWNQDSADPSGELLRPLIRSYLLLPLLGRPFLLAFPFLLGTCFPLLWSPPFPLDDPSLVPFSLAKVRLSLSLTLSPSRSGALDRRLCFFSFWQGRLWCTCQLLSRWHWSRSFLFSWPSMLKFFRWSLRHSARSLLVSAAPTILPFLFSSPTIWLSFCPLLRLSFCLNLSRRSGRNCLLTLLQFYQATMGLRTLVFPGVKCGWRAGQTGSVTRALCNPFPRIHYYLFSDWRRTVSSKLFDTQVPSISTEELVLIRYACCVLSRIRCNEHSLLLSSYFSRTGRIENPSCSACGHSSQDTSCLILHCLAIDSLVLFDLWSRSWGVARLLGFHGFPPCFHPSGNNNKIWRYTTT